MTTKSYSVLGLDCPNCAKSCQEAVETLDFIEEADLNFASGKLNVTYNESLMADKAALKQILKAVRSTNHDIALSDAEKAELGAERSWFEEHREQVFLVVSGALIAGAFALSYAFEGNASVTRLQNGMNVLAAILGVTAIGPELVYAFKNRKVDMNVLMTIAVIGAIILGAYGEAAVVIFLDQIGEYLEGYSMRKTRGSIKKLMTLAPEEAEVFEGDQLVTRSVSDVAIGSLLQVRPGARIPLDGVIVKGSSAIDESPVTGESVPVDKGVDAEVYAGSLNTSSLLTIKTTADVSNSMLSRIVAMVEGAQAQKAPYEAFVDKFAAKYTPSVVVLAAIVAVFPPLISMFSAYDLGGFSRWVYTALTLLVIACPCALVISTPVTFVSGITKASKLGILIKGGAFMELASKVDTIALDKTGTLTQGKPQVIEVIPAEGHTQEEVLALASALEQSSNHPLAHAIVNHTQHENISFTSAHEMREIAGNGVEGQVEGHDVFVGKPAYLPALAQNTSLLSDQLHTMVSKGVTTILVAQDGKELGLIGIADELRPEAKTAIANLNQEGIEHVEILTGDNEVTAQAIAQELGITEVQSSLLPEDKITRIEDLTKDNRKVIMVGDGINDAPALAAAEVGVTMGAAASDTALEVADVALMSADLRQLAEFVHLSKRTMSIVKQNIAMAIGIKLLFFILALAGYATMWMAVFADTGVALLVILNGMRLMIGKGKYVKESIASKGASHIELVRE